MVEEWEFGAGEADEWVWNFDASFTELHDTVTRMEVDKCLFDEHTLNEVHWFLRACLIQLPPRQWVPLSHIEHIQEEWGFSETVSSLASLQQQGKHFKYWEWHPTRKHHARLVLAFYDSPLLPRTT